MASPQRPLLAPPRAYGPGSSYEQPGYSQGGQQSQFGGGQGWPGQGQQGSTALASADGGGALKAKDAPKTVQVRFWLKFHVDYGQTIRIIGSSDALGACRRCCFRRALRCVGAAARWRCARAMLHSRPLTLATSRPLHLPSRCCCIRCFRRRTTRTMPAGAWNLSKAPFLRWSEGDLWNVTLELAAGGVYEYK